MTLVTGRKVGARRRAERRCIRWAACSALLMRASRCLRSAVRVYPLGCQRQVRTLETSRSVCRSAPDVSVVAGLVGARGRRCHAQKEGGGWRSERDVRRNERDALQLIVIFSHADELNGLYTRDSPQQTAPLPLDPSTARYARPALGLSRRGRSV